MKDSNYEHRPLVAMSTTGKISVYPSQGNPPTVRLIPRIKADSPPPEEAPATESDVPRRPRIVKLHSHGAPIDQEPPSAIHKALRALKRAMGR
jgi:hypothetical protein